MRRKSGPPETLSVRVHSNGLEDGLGAIRTSQKLARLSHLDTQ
jgi:hypothetical protein